MQRDDVSAINHFYYCLLIAIKMRAEKYPEESMILKKRYIEGWLKSAQQKKLFKKIVLPEIKWLLEELSGIKFYPEKFEKNIERIYFASFSIANN